MGGEGGEGLHPHGGVGGRVLRPPGRVDVQVVENAFGLEKNKSIFT